MCAFLMLLKLETIKNCEMSTSHNIPFFFFFQEYTKEILVVLTWNFHLSPTLLLFTFYNF